MPAEGQAPATLRTPGHDRERGAIANSSYHGGGDERSDAWHRLQSDTGFVCGCDHADLTVHLRDLGFYRAPFHNHASQQAEHSCRHLLLRSRQHFWHPPQ